MKNFFRTVRGIFSEDLGIDLGTSNTLICVKNKGIILNEPSIVAVNSKTKEIVEIGERAKQMMGRLPVNFETIRPLQNGVISEYEITEKMLRIFFKKVKHNNLFSSPRVIICVPAGVTPVEKRAVIEVTIEAGAREAYLIEEPMAAAIGIGLDIFEPEGHMIVDIGGGTTEIAVLSLGGIVEKSSFKVAGDKFDATIVDFIRQKDSLLIGIKTAEDIKKQIGAVMDQGENDDVYVEISGRSVLNGLPKNVQVYSSEIVEALSDIIQQIVEEIKVILERTPPELASDIKKKGIFITGGGALLNGIDKKISESLNLKVTISDDPLNAVINGINVLLKEFSRYSKILISPETDY
ncbi:MAG: rod shape-determining protein [Fusobacteriaceae bacterium]|jgi:rod shape-determining protein MreB|nr:rod shape-determining protein [Fusobacteriaceae bacterium]